MQKSQRLRPFTLFISILVPLSIGGLASVLSNEMMKQYHFFNKPPLSPPGWLFPIAWTILYITMGIASYYIVVSTAPKSEKLTAIALYIAQLALNFYWPILFFNYSLFLPAFFVLLAMLIITVICTWKFFRLSRTAGLLMIPYIVWTVFAAYLNLSVYILSITPSVALR